MDIFWGDEGYIPAFDPEWMLEERVRDPNSKAYEAIEDAVEEIMEERDMEELEESLEEEERQQGKIEKVPLSSRGSSEKVAEGGTPFERYYHNRNRGLVADGAIEYTPEEAKRILENEIVEDGS